MRGDCLATSLIMLGFMDLGWPRVCRRPTSVLLYPGYYIRFRPQGKLKIAVKWETNYDYYKPDMKWVANRWSHVAFTWSVEQGIKAYINWCDMDVDNIQSYASSKKRSQVFSKWVVFLLGTANGTTVDELYIWHTLLNSQQIWQFYIQGGTVWLGAKCIPTCMPMIWSLSAINGKSSIV